MKKSPILLAALAVMALAAGCNKLPSEDDEKDGPVASGKVVQGSLSSVKRGRTMKYTVWLPAGYDEKKTYPFLYLLHGYGDDNNSWITQGGADKIADRYLADGGEPMVIIMPDAQRSFYVNIENARADYPNRSAIVNMDPAGHFEDYFIEELMPEVESLYHCNKKRALAGLSMGGWGTLYYGLKYPDLFKYYGYAMSPATSLDWYPVTLWDLIVAQPDTSVFPYFTLESGEQDNTVTIASVRACDELLSSYYVRHNLIARPGIHYWTFWPECLEKALVEIGKSFKKP